MNHQIDTTVLLQRFEVELKDAAFSGEDARIEFYSLARGASQELKEGLFLLLAEHHRVVAQTVQMELENI